MEQTVTLFPPPGNIKISKGGDKYCKLLLDFYTNYNGEQSFIEFQTEALKLWQLPSDCKVDIEKPDSYPSTLGEIEQKRGSVETSMKSIFLYSEKLIKR
jgi:hypothetical protein